MNDEFLKRGCTVVGIDLSQQGLEIARKTYMQGRFKVLPADDEVLANLREEPFDIVVSTEIVEHLYDPRSYTHGCYQAYWGVTEGGFSNPPLKDDRHSNLPIMCDGLVPWRRTRMSALRSIIPFKTGSKQALKQGGRFICSTPYHGYLKNLALSLLGKWDAHANPLWDGGHIKLWSRHTLTKLLVETGFQNIQFRSAGRVPWLWMTMVMAGNRPAR